MTRRLLLAWAVVALAGTTSRAQELWPASNSSGSRACQCDGWKPSAAAAYCPPSVGSATAVIPHPYRTQFEPSPVPCGVPTRTALARLGLERHWMAAVPLAGDERLLGISLAEGFVFAQSNRGYFHAFDSESGQLLWSIRLGTQAARVRGASVNSFAVFVTNLNVLYAIERRTGRIIWVKNLGTLPSSATACDEERVMVGLEDGKIYGFTLKKRQDGRTLISETPIDAWNWQTNGPIQTRPLPAGKFVVFGSDDGRVYVTMADEPVILYRVATSGAIAAGFGVHGTRLLVTPSYDQNVYGIDLMTAKVLWTYPSGSPVQQEPLISGDDIFLVNSLGQLTSIDPNGSPKWTVSTQGGPLLAVGAKRVYLKSQDQDMFIVDRSNGAMVADPRTTHERAGLNLRCFEFNPTNRLSDRIYLGNTSGLMIALREAGQLKPRLPRDPKEPPFGYIPVEGIPLTPQGTPLPPTPAAAPAPAEGDAKPADAAAPAPAPAPEAAKPPTPPAAEGNAPAPGADAGDKPK